MTRAEDGGAGARLEAVLRERGLADPRPALRERLRALRDSDPDAFERARAEFDTMVRAADDAEDALAPWIEYGRFLGELGGAGRLYGIDVAGRGTPWSPPVASGAMLLHLPDEVTVPALAVLLPAAPSAAQQASYDLLVGRRLALE